jgi:hypothetical protein
MLAIGAEYITKLNLYNAGQHHPIFWQPPNSLPRIYFGVPLWGFLRGKTDFQSVFPLKNPLEEHLKKLI